MFQLSSQIHAVVKGRQDDEEMLGFYQNTTFQQLVILLQERLPNADVGLFYGEVRKSSVEYLGSLFFRTETVEALVATIQILQGGKLIEEYLAKVIRQVHGADARITVNRASSPTLSGGLPSSDEETKANPPLPEPPELQKDHWRSFAGIGAAFLLFGLVYLFFHTESRAERLFQQQQTYSIVNAIKTLEPTGGEASSDTILILIFEQTNEHSSTLDKVTQSYSLENKPRVIRIFKNGVEVSGVPVSE